jgi:hypothetical protein
MAFSVKPQVFHQFSFPQVGQCNDAYGAVVIATKLAEALECGLDGPDAETKGIQWEFVGFKVMWVKQCHKPRIWEWFMNTTNIFMVMTWGWFMKLFYPH